MRHEARHTQVAPGVPQGTPGRAEGAPASRGPGHIRCEISDRKTRAYRAVIRSVATAVQVMMMALMTAPV